MKKCIDLNDFVSIPDYSRYLVSKDGDVYDTVKCKLLKPSVNPAGYRNYYLYGDNGKRYTYGRHRLLCVVFKPIDDDISNLVANHINGIKGDDRLDNLEWVTQKGNVEHAGLNNLTDKCLPVSIRHSESGKVYTFPSATECGRFLGCSKDTVLYRVNQPEYRLYPDGYQYRLGNTDTAWVEPTTSKHGRSVGVLLRDCISGCVTRYDKLSDLSTELNVPLVTVYTWLNLDNQPVLPGYIQLKLDDDSVWRIPVDPVKEVRKSTTAKPIKVTNLTTGEEVIYKSCVECATVMGVRKTTITWRLNRPIHKQKEFKYEYL
ncbi:NUMOD1 domain-containing DNA-binding protein [Proteus terrae]|uniref:NUMOD1 domain-containing DNA-binding protein n=1 Tax=Proteus terrae TaxID=1574161 RepID=UPI0032DBEC7D